MILFNVYLTKVYHVRNILTFVNFWTEATNLPTFREIHEILLTLPPMQSMRDLDNLISDMRTVETLVDENSAQNKMYERYDFWTENLCPCFIPIY